MIWVRSKRDSTNCRIYIPGTFSLWDLFSTVLKIYVRWSWETCGILAWYVQNLLTKAYHLSYFRKYLNTYGKIFLHMFSVAQSLRCILTLYIFSVLWFDLCRRTQIWCHHDINNIFQIPILDLIIQWFFIQLC